jgi:hypothetical protein
MELIKLYTFKPLIYYLAFSMFGQTMIDWQCMGAQGICPDGVWVSDLISEDERTLFHPLRRMR